MRIFNVILNGKDAEDFCNQTRGFKIKWIKKNTSQQNDEIIANFLDNPIKMDDTGCGCGKKQQKRLADLTPNKKEVSTDLDVNPVQGEKQNRRNGNGKINL